MNRIQIPIGATMRMKSRGRYLYAKNTPPIVWGTKEPPKGEPVYWVNWKDGQQRLMANRVVITR